MTPEQRGRRVSARVLEDICPRLAKGLGPVDLEALAALVAGEVRQAEEEVGGGLFDEGRRGAAGEG